MEESKEWLWSKLPPAWAQLLGPERLQSPSFVRLSQKVQAAYRRGRVAPEENQVFAALEAVDPADVKVVILGQDPYHTPGKATGLAFSVPARFGLRDSVANIHQEIKADLGSVDARTGTGDLSHWASQGVLLLNTALTVRHGEANSHRGLGWKVFVETLLQLLSRQTTNIVWLLWGAQAQRYQRVIRNAAGHRILKAVHPSPLSARRGFFGCKHFSQANAYLVQKGRGPICW